MIDYYPLAVLNEWHYKRNNGSVYVNKVTGVNGNRFTMLNTAANTSSVVIKDGELLSTDALEAGNFQPWLTTDVKKGDNWAVLFTIKGIACMLVMTVKEKDIEREVEGKLYDNVLFIEAESKMIVNDTLMPLNFFTQYYYAGNVGLIQTTSSAGDIHSLVDYKLN
jgi:hypothetical protein